MTVEFPQAAFFLPPSSSENNGVDFLGLRQANLDMMAALIPGTNNVTSYIRTRVENGRGTGVSRTVQSGFFPANAKGNRSRRSA